MSPRPSTDLTISWIEFAVIRDLYDLVRPIIQQHLPCGAVARRLQAKNRISASRLYELSKVLGVPITFFFESIGGRCEGAAAEVRNETTLDRLRDPKPAPPMRG